MILLWKRSLKANVNMLALQDLLKMILGGKWYLRMALGFSIHSHAHLLYNTCPQQHSPQLLINLESIKMYRG